MIHIVDFGMGNIQAFLNLFKRIRIDAQRASKPNALIGATRLVLPGVGHFDHAMQHLNDSGLRPYLEELVLGNRIPIMGVCVGMQMLAQGSEEGVLPGLNWVPGWVRSFTSNPRSAELPTPHIGWNGLQPREGATLFGPGFDKLSEFYFLHSYYFEAEYEEDVAATATYGVEFDAVVARGNIFGIQCHPEKSHHWGEQLMTNFIRL
jgi:glutamine amidotransferase